MKPKKRSIREKARSLGYKAFYKHIRAGVGRGTLCVLYNESEGMFWPGLSLCNVDTNDHLRFNKKLGIEISTGRALSFALESEVHRVNDDDEIKKQGITILKRLGPMVSFNRDDKFWFAEVPPELDLKMAANWRGMATLLHIFMGSIRKEILEPEAVEV